ncbi:hypothetical protein [Daejeonella sp.]|uniref:hypothetical protein n=1 Tax=Daejeonella sp. TaxID=2805397 RepID=UPI0030BBDD96
MNKLFLVFILLLSSVFSFAQEIHFFDENGRRITKEQFERQRLNINKLGLSFQKGKVTETRLVFRTKTGILSQEIRNTILSNLQDAIGSEINRSEMIIINYHQGYGNCSHGTGASLPAMKVAISEYKSQIKRLGQTSEYHMYATKDGLRDHYGLINWYPDANLLVEKTFFKYKYPCRSFVIIKPNGEYYAYFGEYSRDQVIKQAKKFLSP